MEKFAVDLEKVLDEFEFNEEREEQVPHTSVKSQSLSHIGICQVPLGCTPAASYRRPSFEPINLAEADFAASPPSASLSHYNNDLVNTHNFNRESLLILNNTLSNRNFINPSSSKNVNVQNVNNFVSIEEVATETGQEAFQPDKNWLINNGANTSVVDEKPDLLDYSSLSPSNVSVQTNHIPTQLPDITTSVWTLPDVQDRLNDAKGEHVTNAPILDLINSSCGNLLHQINVQENVKQNETNLCRDMEGNFSEVQHSTQVQWQKSLQKNIADSLVTDNVKSDDSSYHNDYIIHKFKESETEDNNAAVHTSVKGCVTVTDIPAYRTLEKTETDGKLECSKSEFTQVDNNTDITKVTRVESDVTFSDTSQIYTDTGGQVKIPESNNHEKKVSVAVTSIKEHLKTESSVDKFDQSLNRTYNREEYECVGINFSPKKSVEKRELKESSKLSDHMILKSACIESEVAIVSDAKIESDIKPIGFTCDNDVSEGELEQFLQDLVEEENSRKFLNKEVVNKTENESNKQDVSFNNTVEIVLHSEVLENKLPDKSTESLTCVEIRSNESTDSSVNINKSPANDLSGNVIYQEPEFQNIMDELITQKCNKVVNEPINTEKEDKILEESLLSTSRKTSITETDITPKTQRSEDQIMHPVDGDSLTTIDTTDLPKYDNINSQVTTNTTGFSEYDVGRQITTDTTGLLKHDVNMQTTSETAGLPNYDDVDSRNIPNTTDLPKYDDFTSKIMPDTIGLPKYDDVQESGNKYFIHLVNTENKEINKRKSNVNDEKKTYSRDTELKSTFSEMCGPNENNTDNTTLQTSSELEHNKTVHKNEKKLKTNNDENHETVADECHLQNEVNEHNSEICTQYTRRSEDCAVPGTEQSNGELCNNLDKVQNEGKVLTSSGVQPENIKVMHLEQAVNLENKENCNENLSSNYSVESSPSFDIHSSGPSEENVSLHNSNVVDTTLDVNAKMIPIKNGVEIVSQTTVDEAGIPAEEEKPPRPSFLELANRITVNDEATNTTSPSTSGEVELSPEEERLGKIPPFWVPDSEAPCCMQCQVRFHFLKRRHHCRSCGQVLCSKCCGLKARIEYLDFTEARVCQPCFTILDSSNSGEAHNSLGRQPNPNNPMEYCSTIPPLQQAAGSLRQPPPTVMVPVGVLKREGRSKSDVAKQVMFSDGIRPGGDLTELDGSGETRMPFRRQSRLTKRVGTPPGGPVLFNAKRALDPVTHSFIPAEGVSSLPPTVTRSQGELLYSDLEQPVVLNQPPLKFAVNRNLYVIVKRVFLDCCVNQECWCISSEGLACVGQDEIVLLLECLPQEDFPPKDAFLLVNTLYQDASKGSTVTEMSFTPAMSSNLLGSRDHGGFLYIRPTYQCTSQLIIPQPPYLVALLIDRWETPWARLFPLRLVLRLGAEYRYYPCPLVSVRGRQPLYTDIGHTIINVLADFRKFSYTLPTVRGLMIHMEDRQTTILLPRNRYDQVIRALNNSNESVLAFGANLSLAADSHLVCMQTSEDENTSYHTQAINIHNKPRRVTGASFVVFNGALKTPGLAGKSSIVEDGLMVQVPSDTMKALHTALRDMRDFSVGCGPKAEETVLLQWTADDTNFNIGVKSCIDGRPLDGIPCIRVHNGTDYSGGTKLIRWTEVFILQCEEGADHTGEPLDISRLSESLARATCLALVPHLELLSAASLTTLAVRATIHPENVGYEAGSNGEKLPPLYMKSLDDELVAVVDEAALAAQDTPATLELIFRVMEQG